jgi:hypothetical protein
VKTLEFLRGTGADTYIKGERRRASRREREGIEWLGNEKKKGELI